MSRKLIIIAILCFVVLGILIIPVPRTSRITLHAVKFDASGKEIGQVNIPLEYTVRKSTFMQECVRISLHPFDGYTAVPDFEITDRAKSELSDYLSITVAVGELSGALPTPDNPSLDALQSDSFRYILKVDEKCDRWMIQVQNPEGAEEYFYVASVSGEDTAQELLEYFNFTPTTPTQISINWNMTAYLIRPAGTIVDTFSLPVHGMIQQEESATYLQVNVDLPDDFRYMMKIAEPNGDILIGKNF